MSKFKTSYHNHIFFRTMMITISSLNFALCRQILPVQTFSIDSRIIDGLPVQPGQLPYQLQLRYLDLGHVCGATLVLSPTSGKQIAITAAHCVTFENTVIPIPIDRYRLRAGTIGVNQAGQTLSLKRVMIHPAYVPLNATGSQNDIAILILNGQFKLNRLVQPLALPNEGQLTSGVLTVSGWGTTNSTNLKQPSQRLKMVQLPIIDSSTCNTWYTEGAGITVIYPTNLCAGFEQGKKSTCSGDSGGAGVGVTNGQKRYLAGVVSWGNQVCEAPKSPAVFTRVSSYIYWINSVTK